MQNMKQLVSAEFVTNMIWENMNVKRGNVSVNEMFTSVLAVLYAKHKGYYIEVRDIRRIEYEINDDSLFVDLVNSIRTTECVQGVLCKINAELDQIGIEQFNNIYVETLKELFNLVSINSGTMIDDFYTPREIIKLLAQVAQRGKCSSVYDPFCGTASLVHELPNVNFEGQDFNMQTSLYARVNLEATCGTDKGIKVCDSTREWTFSKFDALVTCPPFGVRLNLDQQNAIEGLNPDFRCKSIDDMVFTLPFIRNNAKISVVLTAIGFCFRGTRDYELRKYLVEHNQLDTIISLPANILYGTSIRTVIVVCKKHRMDNEPIKIVHAEDYYLGEGRKRIFDVDRTLSMIDSFGEDCASVSLDKVRKYDYNLNPALYFNQNFELKEGQKVVKLKDLVTSIEGEHVHSSNVEEAYKVSTLSKNFIEVLLNNSKVSQLVETRRNANCRHFTAAGKKYLLCLSTPMGTRYGLFTDNKDFSCPVEIKAYEINESLVMPEYLVYTLVNSEAVNQGQMSLAEYMMIPIVIDSLEVQKTLINKKVQQYQEHKLAEQEADAKRLGIKQNISDLEHMLGTTQNRIGKIIQRLEKVTPGADNYQQLIKQLKDNVGYMNRTIQYTNTRIESACFNKQDGDISKFIKDYVDAWKNYGSYCFTLDVLDEFDERNSVSFDKGMLTVMLDSILNNAVRHGFHKRKDVGNQVLIHLSEVVYDDTPYLLLSIANNGEEISDGFTIEDYVSRGRYTASTGRTGLGGYHVYQIVKGHNGYLRLDSNKQWNLIVEVLLPINSTSINDLPVYENECI